MEEELTKYLRCFKNLRRANTPLGIAPHKPILLLSVLQAYQQNLISSPRVFITPELVALFKSNWSLLVDTGHGCNFSLPFYHLSSSKFWSLIPKRGYENILQLKSSFKSFSNLNAAVDFAIISNSLFELLKFENSNRLLQEFLLNEYFAGTRNEFKNSAAVQQKLLSDIEAKILHEDPVDYKNEIELLLAHKNEEEIFLRGCVFKREVPKIYNNTCCISGMKVDATTNVSMIDACHIVPFSEYYDDTITNGIALCPNLHRAFDRGLIAIDEEYKVIVSNAFIEDKTFYSIGTFAGKEIHLPMRESYIPLKANFEWHRENRFQN